MKKHNSTAGPMEGYARFERGMALLRWCARFASAFLYIVLLSLAFGDGIPDPFALGTSENLLLAAMIVIFTGMLIAWFWEGPGALMILAGFLTFAVANQGMPQNVVFVSVLLTGLLFLFLWWRSRISMPGVGVAGPGEEPTVD